MINIDKLPNNIQNFIKGIDYSDFSCSKEAKVYFINKDNGYFLKIANSGTLQTEAIMTEYFFSKGLAAKVCNYINSENDYLITEKIPGKDGTADCFINNPLKLCEIFAETLLNLHQLDISDCPLKSITTKFVSDPVFDTLIHGDYCLPNIILNDFKFSGLIDLDHAGIGDKHRDIDSALRTLKRNLKTNEYNNYFLECYGKNRIDPNRQLIWLRAE